MHVAQQTMELLGSLNRSLETIHSAKPKELGGERRGCPYVKAELAIVAAITSITEGLTKHKHTTP